MTRGPKVAVLVVAAMAWGSAVAAQTGDGALAGRAEVWDLTVLHEFTYSGEGVVPAGDLTLSGSTLYGVTEYGGQANAGVVFRIGTDGSGYAVVHHFGGGASGEHPAGGLVLSGSTLFGVTTDGGEWDGGVVFSVGTDGSGFTVLHSFTGGGVDGVQPQAGLTLSGSTLFGTTRLGGTWDQGTVFRIDTNGSNYLIVHNFGDAIGDGSYPCGSVIASGTSLWGMTSAGGYWTTGVLFWVRTDGTQYTLLHTFTGESGDGARPYGSLVRWYTTLYGMTSGGGSSGNGMVFSDSVGGGSFVQLHSFADLPDGDYPTASLTRAGGTLYGATVRGGSNDRGAVFAVATTGFDYAVLYSFPGAPGPETPIGSLTYSAGTLYGVTVGATRAVSVIFRLEPHGLVFADDFETGDTGRWPATSP